MIKKLLFFITWALLFLSFFSISALGFLWEDLWLDLYKSIDEWFEELEFKQYQYEMSGQAQESGGRLIEHINDILKDNWVHCEIESISDMELIAGATNNQIQAVYQKCKPEELTDEEESKTDRNWNLSPIYIENVIREVKRVKASLENRAEEKSRQIYDIARIWLYSDGISENSPFDLITDIEEIDRVIFSEELEYIWEDYGTLDFWNEVDDYLSGNDRIANAPYNRENQDDISEASSEDISDPEWSANWDNWDTDDSIRDIIETLDENGDPIVTTYDGHSYACYEDYGENWLNERTLNWLETNIYASGRDIEDQISIYGRAPGSLGDIDNRIRWRAWIPIESRELKAKTRFGPEWLHNKVYDTFWCDSFFCLSISFVTKQQSLFWAGGGWQTVSVESILSRVADHFDHISKTSLIQGKMTTNNFENNLVIPDLGDMLRWFWIQIQSKPVPILNVDNSENEEKNNLQWDVFTWSNLIKEYYKNLGLSYERSNDLDIFDWKIIELQAIINSWGQPIVNTVEKLEVYNDFKNALAAENDILSQAIDHKIIQEDLEDFHSQFIELERFTLSIDDFAIAISGWIEQMDKIPTQKP